jgi:hypothetical protein
VLLPNARLPDEGHALEMYIIDWELSHLSSISFDLGQMFAEVSYSCLQSEHLNGCWHFRAWASANPNITQLFELKYFKDIDAGVWLIDGFMQGYGAIKEDLAFKTAIHVGTHLICWGSRVAGWGTEEQVKNLVKIGRDFVVRGWEKDRGFFEGTILKCLFT